MIIQNTEFNVGDRIALQSARADDTQTYSGVIKAFCTAEIARMYADIAAYDAAFAHPDTDLADMDFFLVLCDQDGEMRPFAPEWLTAESVNKLGASKMTLSVHYVNDDERNSILNALRAMGTVFSITG